MGTREVFPWGLTDGDVNGWSWGSIGPSMWRMVSFSGMIGVADCIERTEVRWMESEEDTKHSMKGGKEWLRCW